MSVRAAFVLGFFIVLAALAHGGVYTAGHDFVVNRFTGAFEFVPSDDSRDEDWDGNVGTSSRVRRALTSSGPTARVNGLHRRR